MIVVIAILAAISVVAYRGIANNAEAAAIKANLSQAADRLELYRVDNGGYPPDQATLASLLKPDPSTTLTYAVSNSANPPTYCLIATQGSQQFSVSSASNTPSANTCVINLATDPAATAYNTTGGWGTGRWFGVNPAAGTYSLVANAADGPLPGVSTYARKTWTTAPPTGGSGDTGIGYGDWGHRLAVAAGDVITMSGYVRVSRQANVNADAYLYDSSGANVVPAGWADSRVNNNGAPSPGVGGGFVPAAPGVWTRIATTFTVPAGVAGIAVVLDRDSQGSNGAQDWQVGDTFDATSLMVTKGSTLYNYAEGNSPGWNWTGTPNASTSFGPAL